MTSEPQLRATLLAWLAADSALAALVNTVVDAPADGASAPYVAIADSQSDDWGSKDRPGRAFRIALLAADNGRDPELLDSILVALHVRMSALQGEQAGFEIASCRLLRSRTRRLERGGWQAISDYRIRTLTRPA